MYDLLYTNKEITEIRLDEYLERLILSIPIISADIKIIKKFDSVIISIKKAISVGLIIVELITNSQKHAFGSKKKGIINLTLIKLKNKIKIMISDNGIGIKKKKFSHWFRIGDCRNNDKGTKCYLEFKI